MSDLLSPFKNIEQRLQRASCISKYPLREDLEQIQFDGEIADLIAVITEESSNSRVLDLVLLFFLFLRAPTVIFCDFPTGFLELLKTFTTFGCHQLLIEAIESSVYQEMSKSLPKGVAFKSEKEYAKALRCLGKFDASFRVYSKLFEQACLAENDLEQIILLINIGKSAHNAIARYGVYKEFANITISRARKLLTKSPVEGDANLKNKASRYLAISLDASAKTEFDHAKLTGAKPFTDQHKKNYIEQWEEAARIFEDLGWYNSLERVKFRRVYSEFFQLKNPIAQKQLLAQYFESLTEISSDEEHQKGFAVRSLEYAEMLFHVQRYEEAMEFAQSASTISERYSDWRTFARVKLLYAMVRHKLVSETESTNERTIKEVKLASRSAKKNISHEGNVYSDIDISLSIQLAQIYRELGDYVESRKEVEYTIDKLGNFSERVVNDWQSIAGITAAKEPSPIVEIVNLLSAEEKQQVQNSIVIDYQLLTSRQSNLLSQINKLSELETYKKSVEHQLAFVANYSSFQRHGLKNKVQGWNSHITKRLNEIGASLQDSEARENLALLVKEVTSLTKDVEMERTKLSSSIIGEVEVEFCSVEKCLQNIASANYFSVFDESLQIEVDISSDIEIQCTREILEMALHHLVENAARALRTSKFEASHKIKLSLEWNEEEIKNDFGVIIVEDNAGKHDDLSRAFNEGGNHGLSYTIQLFDFFDGEVTHRESCSGSTQVLITLPRSNKVRKGL